MNSREKVVQLRKQGLTIRQIMKRLGMSSPSLVVYYLDQEKEPFYRVPRTKLVACMRKLHDLVRDDSSPLGEKANAILADVVSSSSL